MAKILIVDDNPSNRSLLVNFLGYCGYTLREASDGLQALAMATSERPDLVISDLLMPGMDGPEILRRLRENKDTMNTPVIFWTARFQERDARDLAKEYGVAHVLSKPCDLETIRETVASCLEASSGSEERLDVPNQSS